MIWEEHVVNVLRRLCRIGRPCLGSFTGDEVRIVRNPRARDASRALAATLLPVLCCIPLLVLEVLLLRRLAAGMLANPTALRLLLRHIRVAAVPISTSLRPPALLVGIPAHADITVGPDGNLWFTMLGRGAIGRLSPHGALRWFPVPSTDPYLSGIAPGPDGALWFAEARSDRIGRITLDGHVQEFPLLSPGKRSPYAVTAGPDGNMWFTETIADEDGGNSVGRITPSGEITEWYVGAPGERIGGPLRIITGLRGNLWFTNFGANRLGEMTSLGGLVYHILPHPGSAPWGLAMGPDHALWFTEYGRNAIGRITRDGAIREFSLPPRANPSGLAVGSDGNLWFTETHSDRIGRMTPAGAVKEYAVPLKNREPVSITAGPDRALWFTFYQPGAVGRIDLAGHVTIYDVSK